VGNAMKIIAEPEWHGSYLDEDGIAAEILAKVGADGQAPQAWRGRGVGVGHLPFAAQGVTRAGTTTGGNITGDLRRRVMTCPGTPLA